MALTRLQQYNKVIRLLKVQTSDSSSTGGIVDDLNEAVQIIAAKRIWPELIKTGTIALTGSDGDTTYSLASDVDQVEQIRISSPTSYARVLPQETKERHFMIIPDKTLAGTSTPRYWYFAEPTIAANNVATKTVSFSYRPDQSYTITYSYKRYAPEMDADDDYPFFDGMYHDAPVYYACWKYAERVADPTKNPIYWRGEWEAALERMLADERGRSKYLTPIPGPDEVF